MNRMKQITILGGSGFLGSVLSDLLVEKKYKVVILDTKLKGHFKKSKIYQRQYFER